MISTNFVYDDLKTGTSKLFNENSVLVGELSSPIYTGAVVLPLISSINTNNELTDLGGVNDADGQFINGTNIQTDTEIGYSYKDAIYRNEDVTFIGCLSPIYGHMITDSISKLWYLNTDEYKSNPKHLICISIEPLTKWQYEILELAGVDIAALEIINEVTRFRSVQIPDNSQIRLEDGSHCYHSLFNDTIENMIHSAVFRGSVGNDKKVYLARSKWTRTNCDFGEEIIIPYFKERGYKVIYPEKLTIAQQILLMQGADEMVSTDCSAAHNAIFMGGGKKMILLRKGLFDNAYSAMIASVRDLDTTIIDCSLSVINRLGKFSNNGPFFVYLNDNLANYLCVRKPLFPFKKFKRYVREAWRYVDLPEYFMMEEIYAKILARELKETRERIQAWVIKYTIGPKYLRTKIANRLSRYCMDYLLS